MTGRLWPSALVAAVFAVHPLHVQSVAWIAERKDVLSGLFFVLTLGAYVRYVRAEAGACRAGVWPAFTRRYSLVCLLFALGLLAKPMLVTLPMVLLLLDFWPLGRWQAEDSQLEQGAGGTPMYSWVGEQAGHPCTHGSASSRQGAGSGEQGAGSGPAAVQVNDRGTMPVLEADAATAATPPKARPIPWHLFVEKIPLLLLAVADSALTVHTQVNALQSLDYISLPARIANALVSYVSYLACLFWPRGLAVLYPHPVNVSFIGPAIGSAAILAVVSAGVFICRRRAPYLLVGWLWYLGMLVPVIGLLQVGGQSMADRYTYLPLIGILLGLVWAVADLTDWRLIHAGSIRGEPAARSWRYRRLESSRRLSSVHGSRRPFGATAQTLWRRDMMYPNIVAHYNLGLALAALQRHAEAIEQFDKALAITADDEDTLVSYGQSLEAMGRVDEAIAKYRAALAVNSKSAIAIDRLAAITRARGTDAKNSAVRAIKKRRRSGNNFSEKLSDP